MNVAMNVAIIPILALFIPIIIVPMAFIFKYKLKKREYEHAERMHALELGRTLPGDEIGNLPVKMAVALAIVVPGISMGTALAATLATKYQEDIWMSCMVVSMVSVASGSVLAYKHFFGRRAEPQSFAKPVVDRETSDFYANQA